MPLPRSLSRKRDLSSVVADASTKAYASSSDDSSDASSPQALKRKIGSSFRNIPPSILLEMKHVFAQFDANGDGKISADELGAVLRSLGDHTTDAEAILMVEEVDEDGDGCIDLHEFIELNTRGLQVTGEMVSVDELTAAFDMFDLDKNGQITADELHSVLMNLGDKKSTLEDCKRMIRGVDRKGVGHVDLDDFKLMMTSV